mmetsp:Transcript_7126/g.11230  ORF Transcript_7126/g.11230 Transcript_7126/m.11230 type:complete len:102 (+) Transcript_7126:505-810(+)
MCKRIKVTHSKNTETYTTRPRPGFRGGRAASVSELYVIIQQVPGKVPVSVRHSRNSAWPNSEWFQVMQHRAYKLGRITGLHRLLKANTSRIYSVSTCFLSR